MSRKKQPSYTEHDLVSFAAYRAQFANPGLDSYKTMSDCLYEWKDARLNDRIVKEQHGLKKSHGKA